jgi:hypothetical protein
VSSNPQKPSVDKSKLRLQTTIPKAVNSHSTRIQSGTSDVFKNFDMEIENNDNDSNDFDFETVKSKPKRTHLDISPSSPGILNKKNKSNIVSNKKTRRLQYQRQRRKYYKQNDN